MSELATAARPAAIIAKTARRVAVALTMSIGVGLLMTSVSPQSAPPFWKDPDRMNGWTHLTFAAILLAPWTALAAVVRQKEAFARDQKLAFALERSELERQALDARLHLLQAQVAPHFPHDRWADRRRCASSDSTSAESNTGSIE